jgi:hypothetical protein|tara:strand:+ start:1825 stop:2073 length:249 start_codon:yes stop_codon:yes gene_type:complete
MNNTPTKAGLYWAKFYLTLGETLFPHHHGNPEPEEGIILVHGKTPFFSIKIIHNIRRKNLDERLDSECVVEWGPKIERPKGW